MTFFWFIFIFVSVSLGLIVDFRSTATFDCSTTPEVMSELWLPEWESPQLTLAV